MALRRLQTLTLGALLFFATSVALLAADIDSVLKAAIGPKGIPGVVGMTAGKDKVLHQGAYGDVRLDSVFRIFSMTKPVTAVAAMQLVEQGKLDLDAPAGRYLPELAGLKILTGFDAARRPILKPAPRQPTLRQLLSHSSGYGYALWDENLARIPDAEEPLKAPLVFEPGTRWQYGVSSDVVGLIVERVSGQNLEQYFQDHIFRPLHMGDTTFFPTPAMQPRIVKVANRKPDGSYKEEQVALPKQIKTHGGGGLFSTAADYVGFMQMFLRGGQGLLKPATIDAMRQNQIGTLTVRKMISTNPAFSRDFGFHIEAGDKNGLGFQINPVAYTNGRAANSMAWAGLWNTFFWIDPQSDRCAVLMMQTSPFFDGPSIQTLQAFEAAVYGK
jgi:CubicO group peptidase (beta-lactamase class C family)